MVCQLWRKSEEGERKFRGKGWICAVLNHCFREYLTFSRTLKEVRE